MKKDYTSWIVLGLTLLLLLGFGIYYMTKGTSEIKEKEKQTSILESTNLKSKEDLKDIDKEGLFYVYADSCVHCQKLKPTIMSYLEKDNKLPFKSINLDKVKRLKVVVQGQEIQTLVDKDKPERNLLGQVFKKYNMMDKFQGTPTLLHIKDGKVKESFVGDGTTLNQIPVKNKK